MLLFRLWLLFIVCGAGVLSGQDTLRLSGNFSQLPLTEVLPRLEQQYGLRFSYLDAAVAGKVADCDFSEAGWAEVRACLFTRNGLETTGPEDGYVTLTVGGRRSLSLTVRDANGQPLPFVTLSVPEAGWVAYTDDRGVYEGPVSELGDSLLVSFIGYAPARVGIDKGTTQRVVLKQTGLALNSVLVTDYLSRGVRASEDGRQVIIDPRYTPPLAGFATPELYRLLTLLPGVSTNDESAGNFSIRGGSRDQNLVLWDGIPVYAAGHYFGMVSFFEPGLVDKLRVNRGLAGAAYGGRLAGVLDLKTDREVTDAPNGGASLNLLHGGGFVKVPLRTGSSDVQLAARYSLHDLLDGGPTYDSYRQQAFRRMEEGPRIRNFRGSEKPEKSSHFTEYNGRYRQAIGPAAYLTLSAFRQVDTYHYREWGRRVDDVLEDELISRNQGVGLSYLQQFSTGELSVEATHSNFTSIGNYALRERGLLSYDRQRNSIGESSLRGAFRWVWGRSGLTAGIQAQRYDNGFLIDRESWLAAFSRLDSGAVTALTVAPYVELRGRLGRSAELTIGLRTPYYGPLGKLYVEPRLSGSYRLTPHWLLKGGAATNHQFIAEVAELSAFRVSNRTSLWVIADGGDVPLAAGNELSGGLTGQHREWLVDVEIYRKWAAGLPALNQLPEGSRRGVEVLKSRASGMDLLLKRAWGDWLGWVRYTLSRVDWQPATGNRAYFPASDDRRHQLQVLLGRRLGRWEGAAAWQYHTGNRYTPAGLETNGSGRLIFRADPLNSALLADYHRLDLSLHYHLGPRAGSRAWRGQLGVSLLNVYGRQNYLERTYRVRSGDTPRPGGGGLRLEAVDRIGLGITPNVSMRLTLGKE